MGWVHHRTCVEISGQFVEINPPLLLCGFWALNSVTRLAASSSTYSAISLALVMTDIFSG